MRPILRLWRRFPFLAGLLVGAGIAGGAAGGLAMAGVITAADVYVELAPEVRVWDTHGRREPTSWELVTRAGHRFGSARDVYVETAHVRLGYAGEPGAVTGFAVRSRSATARATVDTARSHLALRAPGARVEALNTQEVVLRLDGGPSTGLLRTRAQWHGYELRSTGPEAGVVLRRFGGPWAVHAPTGSVAAGGTLSPPLSLPMAAAQPHVLTTEADPAEAVVAATPAALAVDSDAAGFYKTATVRPDAGQDLHVYVAITATGVDGPAVIGRPGRTVAVEPRSAGPFVETLVVDGARRDRRALLRPDSPARPLPPDVDLVAYRPLDGAAEALRSEALSGFAATG